MRKISTCPKTLICTSKYVSEKFSGASSPRTIWWISKNLFSKTLITCFVALTSIGTKQKENSCSSVFESHFLFLHTGRSLSDSEKNHKLDSNNYFDTQMNEMAVPLGSHPTATASDGSLNSQFHTDYRYYKQLETH